MEVNLTEPGSAEKVVKEALKQMGHIDILVNNAGMIRRNPLLESKDKDWDQVIAINLSAVYHLSLEVSKVFAQQKSGKIINIGSMLSFQGGKYIPSYTASKHGVAGLTKAFASEMVLIMCRLTLLHPAILRRKTQHLCAPIRTAMMIFLVVFLRDIGVNPMS